MTLTIERKKAIRKEIRDYVMISIAMISYGLGWTIFLLPNKIPTGGVPGVSSVLYWGMDIPVQMSYFAINATLLLIALRILGWRFCVKTIYAVSLLTALSAVFQGHLESIHLLEGDPFMTSIIGGVFMGSGIGLGLAFNGSTGGTDIVQPSSGSIATYPWAACSSWSTLPSSPRATLCCTTGRKSSTDM